MKNKLNLITLILTILFSFAFTSVVWAECMVNIVPPEAIIMYGGTLTFVATTEGEGCNEPNFTWEVSEGTCTGGNIDPDTGTYRAGVEDNECQDTIMVTDAANGGITATASVLVGVFDPSVNIYGPATLGPPCPASATYTAETTLDGDPLSGTYTWELDGETAGTGDSIEVTCTEAGTKTLVVADFAVGGWTASRTITCDCPLPPLYFSGCGKPFAPWVGIASIQGTGTDFGPFSIVKYDSPLVVKGLKLVSRKNQTITQFLLLLPDILFPNWSYPAEIPVTVKEFTTTIDIPSCRE